MAVPKKNFMNTAMYVILELHFEVRKWLVSEKKLMAAL